MTNKYDAEQVFAARLAKNYKDSCGMCHEPRCQWCYPDSVTTFLEAEYGVKNVKGSQRTAN